MKIEAKQRLNKVQASVNWAELAEKGVPDGIISALRTLSGHVAIRYATASSGDDSGNVQAHIYPVSDSSVTDGVKCLSVPEMAELSKASMKLSSFGEVEVYLNSSAPKKPFLILNVAY